MKIKFNKNLTLIRYELIWSRHEDSEEWDWNQFDTSFNIESGYILDNIIHLFMDTGPFKPHSVIAWMDEQGLNKIYNFNDSDYEVLSV